jgi:hypothetical protein
MMGSNDGKIQSRDKLCWTCETKVQAKRIQKPWGPGDLLLLAVTIGLWLPIRLMYEAVATPWRCDQCETRIEPWHKAMGKAAGYGFGGLAVVGIALPGLISVLSDSPTTAATERSAQAIERERARREEMQTDFAVNRDQIIADIKAAISQKQYAQATKRAEPYLFLADKELTSLHVHAKKKARESSLLQAAKSTSASDLARNAELYTKLAEVDPSNPTYQKKRDQYAAKLEFQQKQAAAQAAAAQKKAAAARVAKEKKAAAEKAKQDAIVAKFGRMPVASAWDGNYYEVERYLKKVANDPDSIDLDGCTKVYKVNEGWLVGCDYRGRNAFGGMIRKSNWFTIRHQQVVAIHEPNAYKQ